MNINNILNSNKRQFTNTMKKEGMVVTDYYNTSKTYTVFFRRNNRSTSPEGKLRLFYAQDTDIKIGTVFVLRDVPYVVISQDGIESDVYYTSMAIRCDTYFTVYSNTSQEYKKIPFVTMNDKYTISTNSTISVISGNVVIYTGLNDHVKDMSVNNGYYNYGGYYKVGNYFYNNNIAYLYLTREAMPADDEYIITFDGDTYIDMSATNTYQLSYTTICNGNIIDSPKLTYKSNDTSIATVDGNGLMTVRSTGYVTITATWTDGDNTECLTTFTVVDGESSGGETTTPTATMSFVSANDYIRCGFERIYTVKYTDKSGNDMSDVFDTVFTIANATFDTSLLRVTDKGNKVGLYFEDEDIIEGTFTLVAVDSGNTCRPITKVVELVHTIY